MSPTLERIRRKYLFELQTKSVEDARAEIIRLYPQLAVQFFTLLAFEYRQHDDKKRDKLRES